MTVAEMNPSDDDSAGKAGDSTKSEQRIPQSPEVEASLRTETPEILKAAAKRFDASPITLKSWVRQKRLNAIQANSKAPYFVRPIDVGKLLLESPNVGSVFYPTAKAVSSTGHGPPVKSIEPVLEASPIVQGNGNSEKADLLPELPATPHSPNTPEGSTTEGGDPTPAQSPPYLLPAAASADGIPAANHSKRKRRRSRKAGGHTANPDGLPFPRLKALEGCSAAERLKIVACLNELVGFVASP